MKRIAFAAALCCAALAVRAVEPEAPAATLERVRDAALASDYAYRITAMLADEIGPRFTGTPQGAAAEQRVAAELRALGLEVQLQPVTATHWVRGEAEGRIVGYPGQPDGVEQRLALVALGATSSTPARGLAAEVVVVEDVAALRALPQDQVAGRIVLFTRRFEPQLARRGHAATAYRDAGAIRKDGPSAASELGAVAALVRSVGLGDYRLPHTGQTTFAAGVAPIPALALADEDAELIQRLAQKGPVRVFLRSTARTLPDVTVHNVIADLRGRERADEYVLVSGHLDSWDLGTGAIDDGVGVAAAMAAAEVLKRLGLQPRRTLRVVAWANEENGLGGAKHYVRAMPDALARHHAVVESDAGAGRPLGVHANVALASIKGFEPLRLALRGFGAAVLERSDGGVGSDISALEDLGVPGFAPLLDTSDYFRWHHTAADTLDKVDRGDLRQHAAVIAALAWYLAEMEVPLPRNAPAVASH